MSSTSSSQPITLWVTLDIKADHVEEFLRVSEIDAQGSRTNENGGCLRFDVHRDATVANRFYFYEIYVNEEALTYHQTTDHFAKWSAFRNSGAVENVSIVKSFATNVPEMKSKSS